MAKAENGLTPPTKETKKETKAKAAKAEPKKDAEGNVIPEEPRQRRSKFAELYPEDSKLELLVKENPKKEGSASRERFQHYFKAKTVGDFLTAGGTYGDIAYDVGRMHISVTPPANKAA